MLTEPAPQRVLAAVQADGTEKPQVLLTTCTDLELDGSLGQEWLVVTAERMAVFAGETTEESSALELRGLPIAGVESIRSTAGVGMGLLQAKRDGVWLDLLRYSNRLADRFHKVAHKLEQLRSKGELQIHKEDETDEYRCGTCGLKLQIAGDVCPRCLPHGAVLGRLREYISPHWRGVLVMVFCMLIGVVVELAPPKLQQIMVDQILTQHAGSQQFSPVMLLALVVLTLAGTRIFLSATSAIKGLLAVRIGAALTFDLRGRLVNKLHQLAVSYYDRHQVGALISRVAYDSEVMHGMVQQLTGGFLLQIVQLVGVGLMLFALNAKLALYTLIPMPLVIGGSWYFWQKIYPKYYRYWDSAGKQASNLAGMLSGIRVVKAFAQEERELERFRKTSQYLKDSRQVVEISTANYAAAMQLIFSLGGLIVWYVGGRDVLGDKMTLGSLIAFLAYLSMFYAPLTTLSQLTTWLTSTLTGCQRVFELLDTPTPVKDPRTPAPLPVAKGALAFEQVSFGYDRHQPVIHDVSFNIAPGEMIGIVGRSGSGKTTLGNLLCRFYDVDDGRVTLDGIDVRELSLGDLRRNVAVVLQEPFLFRGTIWENLLYGRQNATLEEGLRAAKAAGAHDFILRSPLGYETPLGERGAGLSGGEKQRLSIARALLYDAPVLVLDEATSSIDTESERAIQDALKVLIKGRTTIAIAHRLSTLRDANRILVFDRGKLAEEGSHRQLMSKDGIYANLVRIQTQLAGGSPGIDDLVTQQAEQTATTTTKVVADADKSSNGQSTHVNGLPNKHPVEQNGDVENAQAETLPDVAPADDLPEGLRLRWLEPATASLNRGEYGELRLRVEGVGNFVGIFLVRLFPATQPNAWISFRYEDAEGKELEAGIIRDLNDWPADQQQLFRGALNTRYLMRTIRRIRSIELQHGHLEFDVVTDEGPSQFTMRWSHGQAQDFGPDGKLIHDVEDNRFVIPNVGELPTAEADLFRRYVYW